MAQRPLNSSTPKIGRDGAPKVTPTPEIVKGQVRQTTGELHPYIHGVEVQDEPNTVKDFTKAIPLHSANPLGPEKLAKHQDAAKTVLDDASRLGRPPEKA
jgi:hypothetical protein